MGIVYLILALVIAIFAVIFSVQNNQDISVALFSWQVDQPLSLVLLVTLGIGILIGWLFAAPSLVKNTFRASGQRKRIGALEKELEDHKTKLNELQRPVPVAPRPAEPKPVEPKPVTPVSTTTKSDTDPLGHS